MIKQISLKLTELGYLNIIKPILFLIDPEVIHDKITSLGEALGRFVLVKQIFKTLYSASDPILEQDLLGISFKNPIGLSAGFDYEAKLTQILPELGFGFTTIGTVTNLPYQGNSKPMLGRLPKSKSLMVNKGFKNMGVVKTLQKLEPLTFKVPVGLSIGKTNLPKIDTQAKAIKDILTSFITAEKSKVKFTHYELNISCPNLNGNVEFYSPQHLEDLLTAVDKLNLKRPVFIKMPINKTNSEVLEMLKVITKSKAKGVIFGNLQSDREDSSLFKDEVAKFFVGNFSGKPTFRRSNELIKLSYEYTCKVSSCRNNENYGKKLIIIGCGGVFSARDAYKKIKLGASLVELITGLIYQGPQLAAEINRDLVKLLEQDGFTNIQDAIGIDA